MSVVKITAKNLEKVCPPPGPGERPRLYWADELPSFGVVAGLKTRSFILQREVNGRPRRVVVGRVGILSLEAALKEARRPYSEMERGIDPTAEKRRRRDRGVTVRQALEEHLSRLRAKGKSEVTAKDIQERLDRYVATWLGRPLKEITKAGCREKHRRITKENGPAVANVSFRYLRAIYNSARKVHEVPAENPTIGVEWNVQFRRQNPIPWEDLPAWKAKVDLVYPPEA